MPFYSGFAFAVYLLCIKVFTLISIGLYYSEHLLTSVPILLPEYDYIVVGCGTAGSLIAHRLATETIYSHIVLEAGVRGSFLHDIPVLGPLLQGSMYDWQYETVPQQNSCLSMKEKKCKWPRGKTVGGTAILNNMIHTRGNLSHYKEWFHGKYSLDFIEKQFQYIERNVLHVNKVKHNSILADSILDSALELGYPVKDLNKEFGLGFMKSPVNQKDGVRWSTSNALKNKEHNVVTGVMVEKILIDSNNAAYGVQYNRNGEKAVLIARKGVIISAGVVNSPQLLLLSGIGPKEHLQELGIQTLKDLPVGKNLQDHVTTGLDLILFNRSLNMNPWDMINPLHIANYFLYGIGPFTSPGCEVIGMLSTNKTDSVDLQFMVLPVGLTSDRGAHLKNTVGLKDNIWEEYFSKLFDKQTASILPILLHPYSKGEIKLKTKNPWDSPVINPNYLTDSKDVDMLVEGLNIITKFVNTEAMKKLGAYVNPQPYPNCEKYNLFSKEYWECYVRELTLTSFHPVGTCKLGVDEDADSVVDMNFNVIGVKNLYVVDGSVLPTLPSGNVNAAIALMANIFFESHFKRSKIKIINTSQKMDIIYQSYLPICLIL